MVDVIVTAFVVLAVFAVNALLLTLFVWRTDPYQFAMWMGALRARRESRKTSKPHSAGSVGPARWRLRARSFGRLWSMTVGRPHQPVATMQPTMSDEPAAARLRYWLALENGDRRTPT
jgi:hypothetical protein